jgi:hypothetical protein
MLISLIAYLSGIAIGFLWGLSHASTSTAVVRSGMIFARRIEVTSKGESSQTPGKS